MLDELPNQRSNKLFFQQLYEVPPVFRLPRGGVHATSFPSAEY